MEYLLPKLKSINLNLQEEHVNHPFSLLGFLYDKVYDKELTHSQILADLLKPYGTHNCGYLFLHSFFDAIKLEDKPDDCCEVRITTERGISENRRIDIFIEWQKDGTKYAVIIENKLHNATDQPNQLADYDTAISQEGYKVCKIIYLPLDPNKRPEINGVQSEVKVISIFELIDWLNNATHSISDNNDVLWNVRMYTGLLKQMSINYKNAQIAMELLNLEDDDLRKLMVISKCVMNDLSHARYQKIVSELQKNHKDLDIRFSELKKDGPHFEIYFENSNYWLEVWIKEEHYDLYLVRHQKKSLEMSNKEFMGTPVPYFNYVYYKHQSCEKVPFKFPNGKDLERLMETIERNLDFLKGSKVG